MNLGILFVNDSVANKPVVVIGGGGHASVIVDILKQQKREVVGIFSPDNPHQRKVFDGIQVFKNDSEISFFKKEDVVLANGIGSLPGSDLKEKVNVFFKKKGYKFETIIANTAIVSPYAVLEEGVQIFSGAVIQPGVYISCHTVINTRAVIEHDTFLGAYNFISPGAVICGQCKTGERVFVGAGATVIQNVELSAGSAIMANALATQNTLPHQKVYAPRAVIG